MKLMWNRVRPMLGRFVAALVVVFLLFGPYIADIHRDTSRLWRLWEVRDSLSLFGTIAGLAVACAAAGELILLVKRPWAGTMVGHVFVLVFGAGVIANVWYHTDRPQGYRIAQYGVETQTLWLFLVGLVAYSLARPRLRLVKRTQSLCLILSPAMALVAIDCLRKPACPPRMDPLPSPTLRTAVTSGRPAGTNPVYVLLFDGWSYPRTFENGKVRPGLANLAALAQSSIVFRNAASPSIHTRISIPRLLFGVNWPVIHGVDRFGFDRDGQYVSGTQMESIFTDAKSRGYNTILIGSAMAYQMLLGEQVDVYRPRSMPSYTRSRNPFVEATIDLFEAADFWADPWSKLVRTKIGPNWALYQRARLGYELIGQDLIDILESQPRSTFAFVHYPVPHFPYMMGADGRCCSREQVIWHDERFDLNRKGYERSLRCVDWWIGQIVGKLRARGLFDDVLLIITSDHGWRGDPDVPEVEDREGCYHRHVPLLVKLPGQRAGLAIDEPFETRHVRDLLQIAISGSCRPEAVQALAARLRSQPDSPPTSRPAAASVVLRDSGGPNR